MNRTKSQTNRNILNRMISPTLGWLCLLMLIAPLRAHEHPVQTHSNASTVLGQTVTSSTLIWETYDANDMKQMQYAVEGGKYVTEDENYPIYVCRVIIDGMPTSGHTEKVQQKHVCVTLTSKRIVHTNFDVLMNKGHLGKIAWKTLSKFTVAAPLGAIRIFDNTYIARHRVERPHNAEGIESHSGADYNLGRLEIQGLGKVKVVEGDREKYYDTGDVLIETEPYRYELRDIKLDRLRTMKRENITELASGQLMNTGDSFDKVEKVMSYSFNYLQYWGTHEGVAKGLPTKIFEKDVAVPAEIYWALKKADLRHETKAVFTKLAPGTAINVTLTGNYVTLEAPYTAKLSAFYHDSESVSRKINAEVRKSYLKDVKMEFSPMYWIENGTVVPTTTTSTTSTTSTTTHATTTSTNEPTPIHEPPLVEMQNVGVVHSGPDSLEKTLSDDSTAQNEVNSHEAPENMSSKDIARAGFGAGSAGSNRATLGGSLTGTIATITLIFGLLNL